MGFSAIINSFIKDFLKDEKESIRFLSVPEPMMRTLPSLIGEDTCIIDLEKDFTPLKPFLEILHKMKPSDELVDRTAYSLHSQTLKNFFKYGVVAERNDFIVSEEVFYEKIRYKETIIAMLKEIFCGNFLILNAQCLSKESIDILKDFEQIKTCGKLIFCFDSLKVETASKYVIEYYEEINNQKNFFNISADKSPEIYEEDFAAHYVESADFDTLYNALINNRLFLSLEQGCSLADWIGQNINNFGFNSFQTRALYMEIGMIYYYASLPDESALYLNNVLEAQFDDKISITAMIFLSKSLLMKNANATALKYARLVEQKLNTSKESPYYALALMTEYLICERSEAESSMEKYTAALNFLEKQGLTNNYLTMMLVIPWGFVSDAKSRNIILPNIEKGFEIARKIDNRFGLSTACHWKGIITSFNGEPEKALYWYYECNRIRTEIGDLTPMIKIRNGLSYEALIRANYSHSYNLINSFISRIDEINDYPEIIITLNNMASSLFFSRHYSEAYTFFQKILHFLHIFELEDTNYNSFLPEYNDILIYKTVIDLNNGDFIRAKINCHNIMHNGRAITPVTQPLLNFLQAAIAAEDGNIEKSLEIFETGIKFFHEVGKSQEHRLVYMMYEYALTLNKFGYKKEGDAYLKKGFEIAQEKNLSHFTKGKSSITYTDYENDITEFEPVRINLIYLEEKAEKERLMNQLHNRIHDYQFLNKIMLNGSDSVNIKTYVRNVLQDVVDYAMAESAFIAEKNGREWKIIASVSHNDCPPPQASAWEEFMQKADKTDHGKLIHDKESQVLFGNISKFEFTGGIILYPGKTTPLNSDNINTINIALSNIQAQLIILKQNEHLLYVSSTDQLSMLNNRRALQEFISLENERLRRYMTKRKFAIQETIAFIDLDNFKYYNDTYGHETGDLLISCFSKLLKRIYRKIDFVARFGGDEFVCVLSDTSCAEGKRVSQRLYDALEGENFFIPELEKFLNCTLDIPKNRRLNFCMGLCSNYDLDDKTDLDKVMANADKALYYSKANGKGCASIWSEIKDKIPDRGESKYLNSDTE